MNLRNLLRRGLAMLLLVATLVGFVPNVFAAEADGDIDDIVIDVPDYLKGEDIVTATFGEDGKIVYETANEEVRSAINNGREEGTYADVTDMKGDRAGTGLSTQQRLAFFIDPSNTEGNSGYATFSLTKARVQNLVAAGVTDLFVMSKPQAGVDTTDTTNYLKDLKTAISGKGSAKVYAWVHCAYDWAYLKANHSSAQYHAKWKYSNKRTDNGTSNEGYVHLANAGYISYMEGIMKDISAAGADGILLDSVRFGTIFTGWGGDMKSYFKTNYNASTYNTIFNALCMSAYNDYTTTYKYKTDGDGYRYYDANGTSITSGSDLEAICDSNTAAAKALGEYRQYVLRTFIGKMKTAFGSSKIIAVALDKEWANTYQVRYILGQYPWTWRSHVKNGFTVTMQVRDSHVSDPSTVAKKVAEWTNVMIGVDFYNKESANSLGYSTNPDTFINVAEKIHKLRYDVNGAYATYRGCILGTACYTMGHIGAQKVVLSGTGAKPTVTITFANPNKSTTYLLGYFHKNRDTNCYTSAGTGNTATSGRVDPEDDTTGVATMSYYVNASTTTNPYVVVSSPSDYPKAAVSAFGKGIMVVQAINYTNDWDDLPFARVLLYNGGTGTANIVGYYPIHMVSGHESCTKFTDTTLVTATCTAIGYKRRTCNTCSYDFIAEVSKTAHSYTVVQSTTPATCTTAGSKVMKCANCTATQTTEIPALGHNYTATVTLAATCTTDGVRTYTCANSTACTYTEVIPATGHSFDANGTCGNCGLSTAKLLHFQEGMTETTWHWRMNYGGTVDMIKTGVGYMVDTSIGGGVPYFYIDEAYLSTEKIGYKLGESDVVQIRIRVKDATNSNATATPRVSFNTGSGYGAEISGNTIALDGSWQIVTIPIDAASYPEGTTINQIKIWPIGDLTDVATFDIDYIYFGAQGNTPVLVTFRNYDGTILDIIPVGKGTKVEQTIATPTRPDDPNFENYVFQGWMDENYEPVDLTTKSFSKDTTLTAYFEGTFHNPEPIASNKRVVDDGDNDPDTYNIEIDVATYGEEVTINKVYNKPLDIVIVIDRSLSATFHADESKDSVIAKGDTTALNKALAALDKTKPEGYYTASNWLQAKYTSSIDKYSGGFITYENMRYNSTKGYWEVWQTITYDAAYKLAYTTIPGDTTTYKDYVGKYYDEWTFLNPGSIMYNIYNYKYHNEIAGDWVPVTTAFANFYTRRDTTYTNSSTTGIDTVTYPKDNVKYRIGVSRLGKMRVAIDQFVRSIHETSANLPQGQYHKIAIIGYGWGTYKAGSSTTVQGVTRTVTAAGDPGVTSNIITLDSDTKLTDALKYVNNAFAIGSTYTEEALELAEDYITDMKTTGRNSQGIVILVTDGTPTHGTTFELDTANAALVAAKTIKSKAKLYALGFMDGLNAGNALKTWDANATEAVKGDNFLHLVSSNYANATAMNNAGSGSNAGYYKSTVDGEGLADHFTAIFNTTETMTGITTTVTETVAVEDVVTREWLVTTDENGEYNVTVERCDYLGAGTFKDPEPLDQSLYNLATKKNADGTTAVSVEWYDSKNAWLRPEKADDDGNWGYKLLVTIGIKLNREVTLGGNNIPTNTESSRVFYEANQDLNHDYEVPELHVSVGKDYQMTEDTNKICNYTPHDFFLDFSDADSTDLVELLASGNINAYLEEVFESFFARNTSKIDGLNNQYVDIEFLASYNGANIYSEKLTYATADSTNGKTNWTSSFSLPANFDYTKDQEITVSYIIRPRDPKLDSLGKTGYSLPTVHTSTVMYYAPKFLVVDYQADAAISLDKETVENVGTTVNSTIAALDSKGENVNYTFYDRNHILTGIETIDYTVEANNAPLTANGEQTVERDMYIIPANVVEYDQTVLTPYAYAGTYTGTWTLESDANVSNGNQNHDNKESHGYDSSLAASGAGYNYSFGGSLVTTVKENIRTGNTISEYRNNNALSFTFTGTGFDVLSQTGPEEGTMIVEAYKQQTDGTFSTTVSARYLVDNYLANRTLYQLPVVHCTGLEHGTYKVVIRAYYSKMFNHYVEKNTSDVTTDSALRGVTVMTEGKIRQILGLSKSEPLEYTLSADRAVAKRAMSEDSYDVHVDGIRVYNTLGDVSNNAIAKLAYGAEANALFYNARDLLLDSESWVVKNNEGTASGVVFLADGNSAGQDATTDGYHLSMSGILKHVYDKATDRYYVINKSNERVKHPDHNTDIYFKMENNEISHIVQNGTKVPVYFCTDSAGKEVQVSATDFRNIIGGTNIAYYNSKYEVEGPKNEIYLTSGNGIAFNAKGATLLQISANVLTGEKTNLMAYNWTTGEFEKVAQIQNQMSMYYDLLPYLSADGDVFIRHGGESGENGGRIALTNIKVVGAKITAPASTVAMSLRAMKGLTLEEPTTFYDEELKVNTAISIGAEMQIMYTVLASDVAPYADFYIEITKYAEEPVVTIFTFDSADNVINAIADPTTGEIIGYQIVYTGIKSMEMGVEFAAVLFAVNENDAVYCGDVYTNTIQNYLIENVLNTDSMAETKTLAVDMLNYGAAAQIYFDYDVDNLVNSVLTEEQRAYGTQEIPEATSAISATSDGVKLNMSISLQHKVMLYVDAVYVANENSNLKFVIKDAATGDLIDECAAQQLASKMWRVVYDDVGARDMRRLITIELYDNDTKVSQTITWNVESYVASLRENSATSEALLNIANAMLTYGDSAAAYLTATGQ